MSKSKSDWIFKKSKDGSFRSLLVKFRLSHLLHPENWDRKSGSSSFRIWWKITSFFIASKPLVGFFWFFASKYRVTLGTFWWKPHVQKISGSGVMAQKFENWEFWSRFSNANISGTKRANRNPIGFSWRPKAVLFKCPMSNLDYLHSFSLKIEVQNAVLKRDRIYISGQSFKYFSRLCRRIILVFCVK